MSKDLNKWIGIGRLGNDPEIRYSQDGKAVATLSVACSDDYKDKQGNKVERTEWVRIAAFGRLAEIIGEYLKKGSQAYFEGKLTTRKWTDKSGNDRYTTEVVVSELQMLGGGHDGVKRPSNDRQMNQYPKAQGGGQSAQSGQDFDDFDQDLPF